MSSEADVPRSLREMELEVEAAGREWMRREQNYFATQSVRMNFEAAAQRGWLIGSGAGESACRAR